MTRQSPPRTLPKLTRHLVGLIRQKLWLQVVIGMFAGVGFGVLVGPTAGYVQAETSALIGNWVSLPGKLFLIAIQFVVVPLVVASVIRGIAAGDGTGNLGKMGSRTVLFFLGTTLIAVMFGLLAANIIQPGQYIDRAAVDSALVEKGPVAVGAAPQAPTPGEIPELIVSLFPKDPLSTFVSGNMLQIVIAAAIIGIALVTTPTEQRRPLLDLMGSVQAACMVIVGWVMRFAPVAVFGLLAHITSRVGLSALLGTGMYVVTVLVGLMCLQITYLLIAKIFGNRSIRAFITGTRDVMLLAFSTSSSAAVMPLTLTTVEKELKIKPAVSRFVVPLGTTINMGGTALYQGVAAVFLAQVFGVDLGIPGMLLITVMATGAAIGSPGTPGVGIVILATILTSVGIPAGGIAIILGVDRMLDMVRTVVNVTGDMVACVVVDRLMQEETVSETARTV
ncbi:MAG: dicarboxylate/amino acid:cation symporter [Alphaproteobacteria bacterium]